MIKCNMIDESKEEYIIHGWLFHYNCYTHEWNAFPKGETREYFNGTCKEVIRAKTHDECMEKIIDISNV